MRPATARALTYAVVAAVGAAALVATPRLPARGAGPVAALTVPAARERVDTLKYGEALARLLERGGVPKGTAGDVIRAAPLDERRSPGGMPVTFRSAAHPDSSPHEIVLQLAIDRFVHLRRSLSGWSGELERLPWTTDTIVVSGQIQTTLYDAVEGGAGNAIPQRARAELTWTLADIFEYRVDMSRDLQQGDSFRVLVERQRTSSGATRLGNILAATFDLSGDRLSAVRFSSTGVSGAYFDQTGKSMRAAFLRAPLEFRRISSGFGLRRHPILGVWK